MSSKRVLIVGAGGFLGGFLVEEALRRGYEVWAGIRESTSREYLTDSAIKFIVFDFSSSETIMSSLQTALPEGEKWDWIVYNLGATKALSFSDFSHINYDYLRFFTDALKATSLVPEKFLFISSLSVLGPGDEKTYRPFTEKDIPRPDTRYGASKLKAEMHLAMEGIPYIILRATGIYGPRDKDYYLMLKSISKGFDFSVGYKRQLLSFIYVEDLANAVFEALEKAPTGETYNVAEPKTYTQKEFRKLASSVLGKKFVIGLPMPLWAVKATSAIAEKIGVAKGKPSTLNRDKFNILKQRNWSVDISKAQKDFGFKISVPLKEGLSKAVEWYRRKGLL